MRGFSMATTTFSGPVVSQNGFQSTVVDTSTGSSAFNVSTTTVTMTGAGGTGGRTLFRLNADAALGSFTNALKAEVVYGASGRTTGLGSAFVAEMTLSAGTSAGTYAPVEIELNLGTGASTGTASSLMYASVNGAGKAAMDDSGYVLNLAGVTAGSNKLFANNGSIGNVDEITHGLKVRIAGADYFLLLATAANFAD
jgi:hypothetical protein